MSVKIKSIGEAIAETEKYIIDRMEGRVTSLRTGYKKLDKCMIDGIEWNSTITIGGRPSVGKSAYSDCLVEGCLASNIGSDGLPTFNVLDFNWELSSRVMLLRRLSAKMRKSYKHIISADNNIITKQELKDLSNILHNYYGNMPIHFCEEPLSVQMFSDTVRGFVERSNRPTLIRVDHTLLAKQSANEQSQVQMLLNLLGEANRLKKAYPVIFMFLTQCNRELEDRQEDGTDRAFPRQGDVYGGDAAAMFSETILLLNKPAKFGITQYGKRGSSSSMVVADDDLFAHIVKNRNAEGDLILHYKENFKHMSITEY